MTELDVSYADGCAHVDSFERFTPEQRAAWIDQEREHEQWKRAFLRDSEARLSRRAKIGGEHERCVVFELIGDSV
jgi:hypothetical protein